MARRRRKTQKGRLTNNQLASLALAALVVSSVGTFLMIDSGAISSITGLQAGQFNTTGNLTVVVAAAVACALVPANNTAVIGPLFPSGFEATDVNGTPTLVINNTGNTRINISVNTSDASILFQGTSSPDFYQIKAGNQCDGNGNITTTVVNSTYIDAIALSHRSLVRNLNFTLGNSTCELDFSITVPADEVAGNKSDLIQFNCTFAG